MTRIEKTQINCSAFITLSATLKEVRSENIIEISNDSQQILLRQKKKHEKEDFTIDLSFLSQLSSALLLGGVEPLILKGEAEKYLRNCSFACYYYRVEKDRNEDFDHFDIFHKIHFDSDKNEETILKLFCRIFRIDFNLCKEIFEKDFESKTINLKPKETFNELFRTINLVNKENLHQLIFESSKLEMIQSLDSLFACKDLLFSKGIDTSKIMEYPVFGIQQDEKIVFSFIISQKMEMELHFKYDYFEVNVNIKN